MNIVERFSFDGRSYVVCSGPNITRRSKCDGFFANGKRYNALGCEVRNSFSDHLQMLIEVEGTELPPIGTITLLS